MSNSAIKRYVEVLEGLKPDNLEGFIALCSDEVHFIDPFNDTRGKPAVRAIFKDMFEKIDGVKFTIHQCFGEDKSHLMEWTLTGNAGRLGALEIKGTSAVLFDDHEKVIQHYDYWDPSQYLYPKLPIIGRLFPWLRSKFES